MKKLSLLSLLTLALFSASASHAAAESEINYASSEQIPDNAIFPGPHSGIVFIEVGREGDWARFSAIEYTNSNGDERVRFTPIEGPNQPQVKYHKRTSENGVEFFVPID